MATRGRFKIPSEKELKEKDESKLKPSSLFQSYKQNTAKTTESEQNDTQKAPTGIPHISSDAKSTTSQPAVKPSVTSSVATSNVATSNIKTSNVAVTSGMTTEAVQPAAAVKNVSPNTIIVNFRQRGNPLLKHIRNVPWEYATIIPDYVMGRANCALFLSLRYHQLHPDYLHTRLKELGKGYDLRVLLVQVDVKEPHHLLKDLAKICILAELTLILAFSAEEAGRYLEAYKVYENKSAEALMEKTDPDYVSQMTECLTTVKSVNKTDSMSLLSTFKSMEGIINASKEDISLCAGFGPQKAQRLYDVFHEPFLKFKKRQANETAGTSKETSPVKKAR